MDMTTCPSPPPNGQRFDSLLAQAEELQSQGKQRQALSIVSLLASLVSIDARLPLDSLVRLLCVRKRAARALMRAHCP
jgi:hypothetical protein